MSASEPIQKTGPAYEVPLGAVELALLGYFTALWSQVDFWMTLTISHILEIKAGPALTLMENMTTGPKINLLRRLTTKIENKKIREDAKQFCTDMGPIIERRNHLQHGVWGWCGKTAEDTTHHAACYYPKREDAPIFVTELDGLCERVSEQTHVIASIQRRLMGVSIERPKPGVRSPAFYFGPKPPPGFSAKS